MTRGTNLVALAVALLFTAAWFGLAAFPWQGDSAATYPPAKRQEVVESLHGIQVHDPYRWLENLDSDEVKQWMNEQDQLTANLLDANPQFTALQTRLEAMSSFTRYLTVARRGNRYFVSHAAEGGTAPPSVSLREGESGLRPLLVSRDLFPDGSFQLSRQFVPSPDGKRVAYRIVRPGAHWGQIRVLDVEKQVNLSETLSGHHQNLGSFAWTPDSRGFFYGRTIEPKVGEERQTAVEDPGVYYHRLGRPQSEDSLIHMTGFGKGAWLSLAVTEDGRYLILAGAAGSDPGNSVLFLDLRTPNAKFEELFGDNAHTFSFLGNHSDTFWFHTNLGAPNGRIVALHADRTGADPWSELVPEGRDPITYVNLVAERFIVAYAQAGRPLYKIFDLKGKLEGDLQLPSLGIVWGPPPIGYGFVGRQGDAEAFFNLSGLADPGTIYRLDPRTRQVSLFLRPALPYNPDDFVTTQVIYSSQDGTQVPMFLAHKKSVPLDRRNPLLLYAYGAFSWAAFPWYQPQIVAWMETGGVYALAGIRGGGEYGEPWHEAGIKQNKRKALEDYLSAAAWLIEKSYTAKGKLVANGGSASGPLVAAAVVQRPDLFAAATIDIPLLDMLRYEKSGISASWVSEFGSVRNPDEFRALLDYSPYHQVNTSQSGACYPRTLITAGEVDSTAPPWHANKFVAAMQAAQGCGNPVLLQVAWGTGHAAILGTSRAQTAQVYARQLAFLLGADTSANAPLVPGKKETRPPQQRD